MKIGTAGKILLTGLVLSGTFTFYTCSCSCTESQSEIPKQVLNRSNHFIISKVGQDYFDKYIKPDYQDTRKISSHYDMVYSFKIPDKPYVNTKIKFSVDTTGQLLNKESVIGLPDCLSNPEKCEFNIDEEQAKAIAEKNDLKQGIKDWKVEFKWESKYNQYVWSILSTFQEAQGSFGFRGNGEIMLIDPNTGDIISQNPWHVM
jgi:Peptidase propeptide and YPEB domain